MKIAIIGAGGVGGYFGGLLANSGVDITFVARGEHFRALRDSGLTVKSVAGEFTIPAIKVVDTIGQLNRPDVVFVASKTYDLENAGRELKSVVGPSTIIIPLQNGIDNDLKIKHLVGEGQVYPDWPI